VPRRIAKEPLSRRITQPDRAATAAAGVNNSGTQYTTKGFGICARKLFVSTASTMSPAITGASVAVMDAVSHTRPRSLSGGDDKPMDGLNGVSSNSDGPAQKRRRSRKGLDKRFECTAEGCGKSYSRAEHL
jgi:hypothetical protein